MNICYRILGWKSLDVNYLEKIINELEKYTDYDLNDVINEAKSINQNIKDINTVIYSALYLNEQAIKEICSKYFPNYENEINKLESNIYCNYSDSGYDSKFYKWEWEDYYSLLKKENKEQYVKEFLNEFGLEV